MLTSDVFPRKMLNHWTTIRVAFAKEFLIKNFTFPCIYRRHFQMEAERQKKKIQLARMLTACICARHIEDNNASMGSKEMKAIHRTYRQSSLAVLQFTGITYSFSSLFFCVYRCKSVAFFCVCAMLVVMRISATFFDYVKYILCIRNELRCRRRGR